MADAIRVVRPTTSARRKMSYVSFSEITKNSPEKSLTVNLKKHAGRDRLGHISIRHRGGGSKRLYRLIDFSGRNNLGQVAEVTSVEYDPNRSAYIMLVKFESGKKAYSLAPKNIKVGDKIKTDTTGSNKIGQRMPLSAIPTGTAIFNIELTPGKGGQIVRAAGTSATLVSKEGKYAQVRLPSGEVRMILQTCYATVGEVSNAAHNTVRIAMAGRTRHMGIRPTVRGKAMNPVDHPHGGGEGLSPIGLKHPKTPTGKPALGYRTRRKGQSDRFIVRRRTK